jgi:predicted nuclease of predicted toxin-antitoxin system
MKLLLDQNISYRIIKDIFIVHGFPPKIIWFKTGNLKNSQILEYLLNLTMEELWAFQLIDLNC